MEISVTQPEDWRECPQCGLVSTLPPMQPGLVADCPRCGHRLWRMRHAPFQFPIACGLAGVFFYFYATVGPFLEISAYGRFQLAQIETGPVQLALQGFDALGLLVLAVTVILPGVKLGVMLVTLIGLETRLVPPRLLKAIFRWYAPLSPWAMIDVYLLGFLVAYTRLTAIASVHLDTALYSMIGLMLVMAAGDAGLDTEAVWRALDRAESRGDGVPHAWFGAHEASQWVPAAQGGSLSRRTIGCHRCALVNRADPGDRCRRCRTVLRPRKRASISRTWAFVIAAGLLYVPANIYPVMAITQLAQTHRFTIMGGIIELADYGLWPLAALVFVASITIPLMKLLILAYMLIHTQTGNPEHLRERTKAYRVIDFIGRWSMIDVFMISILAALVRFGQFASVQAHIGAGCFAAVVVLTMLAVSCFDPRLMWDADADAAHPGEAA